MIDLTGRVCEACGSPLDVLETECSVCGWFEDEGDEPLDPDDLELLHLDLATIGYDDAD